MGFRFGLLCAFLFCVQALFAQQKTAPPRPSQASDTVRVVEILKTNRFDFRTIDSVTQLQILVGDVHIRQGRTLFWADSVVYNEKSNFMEAYGKVHINDADSVNIYSDYLQYDGNKKLATFRQNVKLSDGNSTLYTNDMDYDMNGKVGIYRNGGRIESKQTTLTSKEGFYYADIKDIYFIGDVKMSDPEVALASDSLLYNTSSQVSTFIAPTTIKTKQYIVNTREGYYDLKLKQAKFGSRSRMQDSTSTMVADDFAFDDQTGFGEARGNVQYKDTAQGALLFANRVFFNKQKKNFLATEKPVMVIVQNQDSVFVAADTIYSGLMKDLQQMKGGYISVFDTLRGKTVIAIDSILTKDSIISIPKDSIPLSVDSSGNLLQIDSNQIVTKPPVVDSPLVEKPAVALQQDSVTSKPPPLKVKPVLVLGDSTKRPQPDTTGIDSAAVAMVDTTIRRIRSKEETDTLRFITAFRNVRIYNDSLQAVADSVFYSGVDSVFEMYHNPIAWSKGSQVRGDTMFIFTVNKKPKRFYAFENALVIQDVKGSAGFYNQIRGRTLNGYFNDGELDYVRAKGTAESIYYAQDDDSAFVGMNRTTADEIDIYFRNKSPQKVKFTSSVKGTTFPIRQLPDDQKQLPGFEWLENRRPKSKLELFQ